MSSSTQSNEAPWFPSWVLVEVDDVALPRDFCVIHATQILGKFNPNIRKICFFWKNRQHPGIVLVISDHRRYVEEERERLLGLEKNSKRGQLWALVRIPQEGNKVRLTTLSFHRLRCDDADKTRQTYLSEPDGSLVPIALLQILDSQKELRDVMAFTKEKVYKNFASKKRVDGIFNLDQAYLLVQYYEDSSNLVFAIVSYAETMWKDKNRFPMVVAYLPHEDRACQSLILRMSYDFEELANVLDEIRVTCDKQDYCKVHAQLKICESRGENLYRRELGES